jgi:hypothetical protein
MLYCDTAYWSHSTSTSIPETLCEGSIIRDYGKNMTREDGKSMTSEDGKRSWLETGIVGSWNRWTNQGSQNPPTSSVKRSHHTNQNHSHKYLRSSLTYLTHPNHISRRTSAIHLQGVCCTSSLIRDLHLLAQTKDLQFFCDLRRSTSDAIFFRCFRDVRFRDR